MKQSDQIVEDLKNAKVVSLIGKWGSGKTYNWENNILKKLKELNKKTIYISLFGKKSTEEVKRELFDKLISLKDLTIKILTLVVTIIILSNLIIDAINKFFGNFFNYKSNIFINALILLIIFLYLRYYFYKPILKFSILRFMGIDHTNIDWKLITPKNKPVLCFDDIERIQDKSSIITFCGFIEELKKLRFPILLIINDEKTDKGWKEYKEKIIDLQYNQKIESTLEEIFTKYNWLNDIEKEYISKISSKLSNAQNELNLFKDLDHEYIKQFSNNFRFIIKVIESIYRVRSILSERYYKKLEPEQQLDIISYIAARTLITELGIDDKDLLDEYSLDKDEKKLEEYKIFNFTGFSSHISKEKSGIGSLITYYNGFPITWVSCEIKNFLETKECNLDKLKSDIIKKSKFELYAKEYDYWKTSTKQSKIIEERLYNLFIEEEKPFTSFFAMKQSIRQYLLATSAINKKLSEEKHRPFFDALKRSITIDDIDISNINIDFIEINNNYDDKNSIFFENTKLINYVFKHTLKEKYINHYKDLKDKDFFIKLKNKLDKESYNSYYISLLIFILFSNKQKQEYILKLKENNFSNYIDFLYKVIPIVKEVREIIIKYFMTENNLKNFIDLLEKYINELKNIKDSGLIENKHVENLLEKLNKLKQ